MKPSKVLWENRNLVKGILSHYPMFSNIRVTGSIDRMEDDELSDIDLYLDADSTATLLDISRLQSALEELLEFEVDIFSSNMGVSKFYADNNPISGEDSVNNE